MVDKGNLTYRTCDLLNATDALDLIDWLASFVNFAKPTPETVSSVAVTAHLKGAERNKKKLLAEAMRKKESN